MRKALTILFSLLCFVTFYAQNDSIKTVEFKNVEKVHLALSQKVNDVFKYDFKIVDSTYYHKNLFNKDLLTADYDKDFELQMGDRASIIKFECKERIPETCYSYGGYSENAELHLISKCREICELYLIDAYSGSTLSIESEFDGGSFPVFLPGYMMLCSSYYDDSFGEYYEYRSIIDVYKMKSTNDLGQKFEYVGSINSKNWSIREVYQSSKEDSFLMKIYDEPYQFDYVEITIE